MELVGNLGIGEAGAEFMALKDTLNSLLLSEETFWCQREKVYWMQDGDMNSLLFHTAIEFICKLLFKCILTKPLVSMG